MGVRRYENIISLRNLPERFGFYTALAKVLEESLATGGLQAKLIDEKKRTADLLAELNIIKGRIGTSSNLADLMEAPECLDNFNEIMSVFRDFHQTLPGKFSDLHAVNEQQKQEIMKSTALAENQAADIIELKNQLLQSNALNTSSSAELTKARGKIEVEEAEITALKLAARDSATKLTEAQAQVNEQAQANSKLGTRCLIWNVIINGSTREKKRTRKSIVTI